jgi:hypothetical protein
MQLIENTTHAYQLNGLPCAKEVSPAVSNRLLVLLGSSLLVVTGPAILGAVAQASLAAMHLFLEICRIGLVAYQILGR